MFLEHKFLYERLRDEAPDLTQAPLEMHQAALRRQGDDCTIVCWGAMVHLAVEAAEVLAREQGVQCDVVDLRCPAPVRSRNMFDLFTTHGSSRGLG